MWPGSPSSMAGRRGHGRKYPPSKAPSTPSPGRCAPSSPTASHRANWRVPKIILSAPPPARGPPSRCRGEGVTPGTTPHQTPLWPRRREGAPPPPSRGPPPPSSTHPIRPPLPGGPPLDAGAKGARLEVPPIEGPSAPSPGRCAPSSPLPAHFESDGQAAERTGEYRKSPYPAPPTRAPPSSCRGRRGTPRSTPPQLASTPNAHYPSLQRAVRPMVFEPTGHQTSRSDAGPGPVVRLPPPSARRCRNN